MSDTLSALHAISPVDGRYAAATEPLAAICSEAALIRYRIRVEVAWLHTLITCGIAPNKHTDSATRLQTYTESITPESVKQFEKTTNHDVKAVEYAVAAALRQDGLEALIPFVHFALTSEDVNATAYALMLTDARAHYLVEHKQIREAIGTYAEHTANIAMLARTHGQAASPTTLGKECANWAYRLHKAERTIATVQATAKFSGAVGNCNAHIAAFPDRDWDAICRTFVESLRLTYHPYCTQIEPHDNQAALFDAIARSNTILIDCCRDIWGYIAFGYFGQKTHAHETGSSTMPHKVNPIDFENAEGNLGIANALFGHFSQKLPISRFQRDLSDSTVQRAIGTAFAHTHIAHLSFMKGFHKLTVHRERIAADLDNHWEVLGEAIQTVMRAHGIADAYEQLKAHTRGKPRITKQDIHAVIRESALPDSAKDALLQLTPATYIGNAAMKARTLQDMLASHSD